MGCLKSPSHPCKCCTSRNSVGTDALELLNLNYIQYIYIDFCSYSLLEFNSSLQREENKSWRRSSDGNVWLWECLLGKERRWIERNCGYICMDFDSWETFEYSIGTISICVKKVIRILIYVNVKIIIRNKFNLSTIYILFFFLQMKNNAIQIYFLV